MKLVSLVAKRRRKKKKRFLGAACHNFFKRIAILACEYFHSVKSFDNEGTNERKRQRKNGDQYKSDFITFITVSMTVVFFRLTYQALKEIRDN